MDIALKFNIARDEDPEADRFMLEVTEALAEQGVLAPGDGVSYGIGQTLAVVPTADPQVVEIVQRSTVHLGRGC